jgi:hypothetical protein
VSPRADPCERNYRTRLLPWVFGEKAVAWMRVQDLGVGYPAIDVPPETLPRHPVTLTTSSQCAQPASHSLRAECLQCRRVAGYSMVVEVPLHHATQPLALLWDRLVTPKRQRSLHLDQLGT